MGQVKLAALDVTKQKHSDDSFIVKCRGEERLYKIKYPILDNNGRLIVKVKVENVISKISYIYIGDDNQCSVWVAATQLHDINENNDIRIKDIFSKLKAVAKAKGVPEYKIHLDLHIDGSGKLMKMDKVLDSFRNLEEMFEVFDNHALPDIMFVEEEVRKVCKANRINMDELNVSITRKGNEVGKNGN